MKELDIDWASGEIGEIPVLAHYNVKGKDILFPVRIFNGAVLDDETQEHAFAEEKLFGRVCLKDVLGS